MNSPYTGETRLLLRSALVLFVITVVIGILNGTDLVDFNRKQLLTHVHVGTLGWITMSVIAASYALFSLDDQPSSRAPYMRGIAIFTPIAIALYALAFLTTTNALRPIVGTAVMIAIVFAFGWAVARARTRTLSTPHVAILAALATSVLGAVLGVLLGARLAGASGLPDRLSGAHPAAMVVGFLVPAGMAFIEWTLDPESLRRRATRAGWLQVGLPFTGGVLIAAGLLLNSMVLATLSLPFEVIGLIILIVRMRGPLSHSALTQVGAARHGALALLFLAVNISLLVYLIGKYFAKNIDPPVHVLLALDHSIFIGVMTNSILGLIIVFRQRAVGIADQLIFWGLNIGISGFVIGLILDMTAMKRTFTPIMGLAILLAVVMYLPVLGTNTREDAPAR